MHSLQYKTVTATGAVITGPCLLWGVVINDAGANTFSIYDAEDATNLVIKLSQGAAGNVIVTFSAPLSFKKGIYYGVTGATSTACFLVG